MSSKNTLIQSIAQPLMFQSPAAHASLSGSPQYPAIRGEVLFYRIPEGTLVLADVTGLPQSGNACAGGIYGFHIHEGASCTGNAQDAFANAGSHYNPANCPHPGHAGDLPPLFGNNGHACMGVVTARFTPDEVTGRTVIIHDKPDDFTSQPSGNAGTKIACGVIERG